MDTLTFHCGHPVTDGHPRMDSYPDCFDCQNMASQVEGVLRGLPQLQGTARQVAWAESVRLTKIDEVKAYVESWPSLPPSRRSVTKKPAHEALKALGGRLTEDARREIQIIVDEERAEEQEAIRLVHENLSGVSLATWWIDRRRWPVKRIIEEFLS